MAGLLCANMSSETPVVCPVCWDRAVEPVHGVRLSVTINGIPSDVHGVSVFRCSSWHLFILIAPRGSLGPSEKPAAPVARERG